MNFVFTLDIPTIMGAVSLIGVLLLAAKDRLAIEVAAVMAIMCIGLIFAN